MGKSVEDLHDGLTAASSLLLKSGELSLSVELDEVHRKALLLSVASYFEAKLSTDVDQFSISVAGKNSALTALVKSKAISRQYHTWFKWDSSNANTFFALFGQGFKSYMETILATDQNMALSIKEFLSLGSDRNRLVHQNFSAFPLEASAAEIMGRYRIASHFVENILVHLRKYEATVNHDYNAEATTTTTPSA